jgi:hypothetical protein
MCNKKLLFLKYFTTPQIACITKNIKKVDKKWHRIVAA